jgi:hypothetical protein
MDNIESEPATHPVLPVRDTVESDPDYDFAEDIPVDEEEWDEVGEPEELADEDERVVPLADDDEFREPEDEE